jgi:hypothetical protein
MKTSMLIAAVSLAAAPVNAVQLEGNKLVLSPEEIEACAEQGGCALVTRAQMEKALSEAFKLGQQKCGVRT